MTYRSFIRPLSRTAASETIVPAPEVSLAEGANTITVTAEDGATTQTYTVTVTRASLPAVSVAAAASRVSEGERAEFRVALSEPAAESLRVGIRWERSDQSRSLTQHLVFLAGTSRKTPSFSKSDDKVVREDLTVTITLEDGEGYQVSEDARSAQVVLEENNAAGFPLSVDPASVEEDETVTVEAAHGGAVIGTATLAITDSEPAPEAAAEGFSLVPENSSPSGIWSDGETAWVADLADARLYACRREDGERQAGKDIATEASPMDLWSDGRTLWVADWRERVNAYRLADGSRDLRREIEVSTGDTDPTGLWSGGGVLLTTGWESGQVRAYRVAEAAAEAPGKKPGSDPTARAASLPAITGPALRAAIGAALGKGPGEAVSPQELAGLEEATARNAGIQDLSGLERAVLLKELDVGFNPLADLQPLAALPALESLNLDGTAADLQALAALPRAHRTR